MLGSSRSGFAFYFSGSAAGHERFDGLTCSITRSTGSSPSFKRRLGSPNCPMQNSCTRHGVRGHANRREIGEF